MPAFLISTIRYTRLLWLAAGMLLWSISFSGCARADYHSEISDSPECARLLNVPIRETFRNPADEINYTNRYNNCWAEAMIMHSKQAQRSAIGHSLELFANPAAVEASGFSKRVCKVATNMAGFRSDYPCWFEIQTAQQDVSLELAAKREVPKILFATAQQQRDGSISVEYILCTNDDPTKPKEYSKGCARGKNMTLTEYGRGDINNDHEEDVLVSIKYGDNSDDRRKCFIGAFTRREGQLMHMFAFSPTGLCQ